MKKIYIILYMLTSAIAVNAQDSMVTKRKLQLNGYIKEMGSLQFDKDFRNLITGNLLHNRINIKWKSVKSISGSLEIRNRVFWGDMIKHTPDFSSRLRNENEWLNMSALWVNRNNFVFQSNIDRAWAEYGQFNWNIRLGRQRINWGLTTVWNPNDIFNPYNFLDFDYEERPGTDAARFIYNFKDSSSFDLAINPYGNINKSIAAARYSIDKWGYHLQMIAGMYQHKLTAGFGWTGRLGNFEYKGEGQAFISEKDSADKFNYSLELSYAFKKGWFASGSVLHNTSGLTEPVSNPAKMIFRVSPTNPMPARWSFVAVTAKAFTPAFSGQLNLVYSPGVNLFIVYPSLKFVLLHQLEAALYYQSFYMELQKKFQATSHTIFIRFKWSF